MQKKKIFSIFLYISTVVFFSSCITKDRFEEIPADDISDTLFSKSNTPIEAFLEQGFKKESEGNVITITKDGVSKKQTFKNVVFVSFVDQNYVGIITGLPAFDAGWRYLVFPTYSDIVIMEKDSLEIVFKKTIRASVSDLNLSGGFVYFEYGTYPNLKYGRFPFK